MTCDGENSIIVYASPECTVENIDFTHFNFRLRQGELDPVAGGNFDFRPSSVPEREFFASNTPILYLENAKNVRLSHGSMSWGESITQSYFTTAIEAHGVDRLTLDDIDAAPSPVHPRGEGLATYNCRNVTNRMKR